MNQEERERVWKYAYDMTRAAFSETVAKEFADNYLALHLQEVYAWREIADETADEMERRS